jgi:hypothetical protein
LTIRAFRSAKGLVGGFTLLVATTLAMVGLTACSGPGYSYVADSADHAYYKVPTPWHEISQSSLNAELHSQFGNAGPGLWSTAFDDASAPTAGHFLDFGTTKPFVFAEAGALSPAGVSQLSYNALRNWLLPVTADSRQNASSQAGFQLSNFTQIRDDTITGSSGVHGVRETFQYSYRNSRDTFDEDVLTNADQTKVYVLLIHCTDTCYSQNQSSIDTVMSSFTVRSS